jgi:phage baseplate assembly protein W
VADVDPSRDFLASGWSFPLRPIDGRLEYIAGEANVDQSVELLLRTEFGERVMRPDFGTAASELLFESDRDQELHRLETTLTDALRQWEPRVEVETVVATRSASEQATVVVTAAYRIRQTNTRRSVTFPYYLDHPGVLP